MQNDDPRPTALFVGMTDNMLVSSSPLDIKIIATATTLQNLRLEWGIGDKPVKWNLIVESAVHTRTISHRKLGSISG